MVQKSELTNYTGFDMPRGARDSRHAASCETKRDERSGERERVRDFRASIRGNLAKGIENVRCLGKEIVASNR